MLMLISDRLLAQQATPIQGQKKKFSIEPNSDIAKKLANNLFDKEHIQIYKAAIGKNRGKTKICRNEYLQALSILPLASNDEGLLNQKRRAEFMQVPITTLGDLFAEQKLK